MTREPAGRSGDSKGKGRRRTALHSPRTAKCSRGASPSGPKAGITLWEVASGRVLRSIGDSFAGTMALAFSPDGKRLDLMRLVDAR